MSYSYGCLRSCLNNFSLNETYLKQSGSVNLVNLLHIGKLSKVCNTMMKRICKSLDNNNEQTDCQEHYVQTNNKHNNYEGSSVSNHLTDNKEKKNKENIKQNNNTCMQNKAKLDTDTRTCHKFATNKEKTNILLLCFLRISTAMIGEQTLPSFIWKHILITKQLQQNTAGDLWQNNMDQLARKYHCRVDCTAASVS